jgi:hypothetical protein
MIARLASPHRKPLELEQAAVPLPRIADGRTVKALLRGTRVDSAWASELGELRSLYVVGFPPQAT